MNKKKVVLLLTGLHYGGMERVALIAYELLKDNYNIQIVTLYSTNADYKTNFNFVDLKCPPIVGNMGKVYNTVKRIMRTKSMKRKLEPDIVISFGTAANFVNSMTKSNDKVILGIRSYDWLTDYFVNFQIDKFTYNKADKVVSVSKVIANYAESKFQLPMSKSAVLYNPYDVNYIQERSKEEVTDFHIPAGKKVFLSVGRLVNQKGFNHLVKAFSLIISEHPEALLVIIGQGEKETEILNLIKNLKLEKHIFLLGPKDNPYKYMRITDFYVLSSVTEGFPNAMVEAMSVGKPIIATDCKSGPREILSIDEHFNPVEELEYSDFGILSPEVSKSYDYNFEVIEDCDYELAKAMKIFLINPHLSNHYSARSYERANQFTYNNFKNNFISIVETL